MNRLIYVLALLLTMYASIFYDVMYFRAFFVVLALLPLLLYAIIRYQKEHLTVTLSLNTPLVTKRIPFTVSLAVDNRSKIPISRLTIRLSLKNGFAAESGMVNLHGMADSESVTHINYTVTSDFCGQLSVHPDVLRIYDIFGITCCRLPDIEGRSVIVMPQIHHMDIRLPASAGSHPVNSGEFDPHRSGDDGSEIFSFREYHGGDRPNQVHWKLSIKSEDLMVREFSRPIEYSLVLLLDLAVTSAGMIPAGNMDRFIETAASLSHSMLALSCYHYVCWYSAKEHTLIRQGIRHEENLADLLVQLLEAEPYEEIFHLTDLYQSTYHTDTPASPLILDMNLNLQKDNQLLLYKKVNEQDLKI